jgi:hypothetical protein
MTEGDRQREQSYTKTRISFPRLDAAGKRFLGVRRQKTRRFGKVIRGCLEDGKMPSWVVLEPAMSREHSS